MNNILFVVVSDFLNDVSKVQKIDRTVFQNLRKSNDAKKLKREIEKLRGPLTEVNFLGIELGTLLSSVSKEEKKMIEKHFEKILKLMEPQTTTMMMQPQLQLQVLQTAMNFIPNFDMNIIKNFSDNITSEVYEHLTKFFSLFKNETEYSKEFWKSLIETKEFDDVEKDVRKIIEKVNLKELFDKMSSSLI